MALEKEKEITGFVAKYWKISQLNVDFMTSSVKVELSLFKDEETRQENKRVFRKMFTWNDIETFQSISALATEGRLALVYAKIKESNIQREHILDDMGEPVLDSDGEPTYTDVEKNWFVDAIDV